MLSSSFTRRFCSHIGTERELNVESLRNREWRLVGFGSDGGNGRILCFTYILTRSFLTAWKLSRSLMQEVSSCVGEEENIFVKQTASCVCLNYCVQGLVHVMFVDTRSVSVDLMVILFVTTNIFLQWINNCIQIWHEIQSSKMWRLGCNIFNLRLMHSWASSKARLWYGFPLLLSVHYPCANRSLMAMGKLSADKGCLLIHHQSVKVYSNLYENIGTCSTAVSLYSWKGCQDNSSRNGNHYLHIPETTHVASYA